MRLGLCGLLSLIAVAWSAAGFAQQSSEIRCPDIGTKLRLSNSYDVLEVIQDLGGGICRYRNTRSHQESDRFLSFDVKAKTIAANLEELRRLNPLQVGKSVTFTASGPSSRGTDGAWEYNVTVEKFETVKVPVGDLPTFLIVYDERSFGGGGRWQYRWWYSPIVRYPVQFEFATLRGNPPPSYPQNWKLVELTLPATPAPGLATAPVTAAPAAPVKAPAPTPVVAPQPPPAASPVPPPAAPAAPRVAAAAPPPPVARVAPFDGEYRGGLQLGALEPGNSYQRVSEALRSIEVRVSNGDGTGTVRQARCAGIGSVSLKIAADGAVSGEMDALATSTCEPLKVVIGGRFEREILYLTASTGRSSTEFSLRREPNP